jgi:uncharacterized membrane protein YhhN
MTESLGWLTGFVLVVFLLDWLAVGFSWRKLECFLKPMSMIMVMIWTLAAAGGTVDHLLILLLIAQAAGLAGDVFLLLSARWFLLGLGAFLVGHLFYIGIMGWQISIAVREFGLQNGLIGWLVLIIVMWGAMLWLFYRIIAPKTPRLTMPLLLWTSIQVYGWILSGLVMMSILVIITAAPISPLLIFLLVGTLLFFVSDSLLAYDRFKRKMPKVRLWIMVTYHLAQFSLAAGFLVAMDLIR